MDLVGLAKPVVRTLLPPDAQVRLYDSYLAARGLYFAGDEVYCPVCEQQYAKFLPSSRDDNRPNAFCPGCGSAERHRHQWLFMKNETDLFDVTDCTKRVLHVAPERQFQKRLERLPHVRYISVDIDSPMADEEYDITDLPPDFGEFDVMLCSHVLEHVEDDMAAMEELARVLSDSGWGILDVPCDYSLPKTDEDPAVTDTAERKRRWGHPDHRRRYGADYPDRLARAGFSVERMKYFEQVCRSDGSMGLPEDEYAQYIHYVEKA